MKLRYWCEIRCVQDPVSMCERRASLKKSLGNTVKKTTKEKISTKNETGISVTSVQHTGLAQGNCVQKYCSCLGQIFLKICPHLHQSLFAFLPPRLKCIADFFSCREKEKWSISSALHLFNSSHFLQVKLGNFYGSIPTWNVLWFYCSIIQWLLDVSSCSLTTEIFMIFTW